MQRVGERFHRICFNAGSLTLDTQTEWIWDMEGDRSNQPYSNMTGFYSLQVRSKSARASGYTRG